MTLSAWTLLIVFFGGISEITYETGIITKEECESRANELVSVGEIRPQDRYICFKVLEHG